MQDRLLFVISPPRAGSTLLQQMLASHSQIYTHPEPHLITPLAYLGYHDTVDKAPYDHINGAEAIRAYVARLRDAGVPVTHAHYPEMVHGFMSIRFFPQRRDALARSADFVRDREAIARPD